MSTKGSGKTIGILASLATITGVCIAAVALIPEFGQWLLPREAIPSSTVAPEIPGAPAMTTTPQLEPTPDLWQFYVDDIKESVPNASVTSETLQGIAAQIPASIPYFAEAEVGLIPYQHNGNVVDRAGPVPLNVPEGGYAYISWGNGRIRTNEISIDYRWSEGNIYLVLIIGKPDDSTSADLNTSLELSDSSSANVYTNFAFPAPSQVFHRAVINKAWFSQQLWWAQGNNAVTVSIVDLGTRTRLDYNVDPESLTWSAQ